MYNIGKFTNRIKTRFDFEIKNNLYKEYDYFITGSEQVWNPELWMLKNNHANIRFLKFAPKEKRIAYTASIAISSIPKDKEQFFKDSLNEMKAISKHIYTYGGVKHKLENHGKIPLIIIEVQSGKYINDDVVILIIRRNNEKNKKYRNNNFS